MTKLTFQGRSYTLIGYGEGRRAGQVKAKGADGWVYWLPAEECY